MIRSTRVLLTAFVVLAGPCAGAARAGALTRRAERSRRQRPMDAPPMAPRLQTAVFVVLENKTGEKRQLVSATSSISDKVELHTMSNENRYMMRMSPVKAVDVPANGKAEPAGQLYIMLFDLKQHPVDATVDLTLTFDNGQIAAYQGDRPQA